MRGFGLVKKIMLLLFCFSAYTSLPNSFLRLSSFLPTAQHDARGLSALGSMALLCVVSDGFGPE
jgi:hypothetical protein